MMTQLDDQVAELLQVPPAADIKAFFDEASFKSMLPIIIFSSK